MSRPRIASTTVAARLALALMALGLAACSFSFKSGSSATSSDGKPAVTNDEPSDASSTTRKPLAKHDPAAPSQPAEPDDGGTDEDAGPTRTPPTPEPPPSVEPQLTAVCRVHDSTLASICHAALDPIAADDLEAWTAQLGAGVVLTQPTYRKGMQRLEGQKAVHDVATRAGGLRALLHLRPTDRVVGTLAHDCRQCRRAIVEFQANSRSGTFTIEVEMTQPPTIAVVEVDSHVRRRHLEGLRKPSAPTKPAVIVPPASPEIVEPPPAVEPAPAVEPPPAVPPKKKPALAKKPTPAVKPAPAAKKAEP